MAKIEQTCKAKMMLTMGFKLLLDMGFTKAPLGQDKIFIGRIPEENESVSY
jgi:hypothetical protein